MKSSKSFIYFSIFLCSLFVIISADAQVLGRIDDKGKLATIRCYAGMEIIEYVKNSAQQKGTIQSILYKISNRQKKRIGVFRPHLYVATQGEKPGKELLPQDIPLVYVKEQGKEVILKIDISNCNINATQEDGVFVGLEFLGEQKDGKTVESDTPFGIWHIILDTPGADDITYIKWKGKITDNLPEKEPWGCFFGIEIK